MNQPLKVLGIQVSLAKPIDIEGRRVMTGIMKKPVQGPVRVTKLGLEGDEQADPSVHGGLSKAVYAYPVEHYGYWKEQAENNPHAPDIEYGILGENLTVSGLLENELYVGDRLQFHNCTLKITEPRQPCYKFNAVMNDPQAARKLATSGYTGFYLSVVSEGYISPGEAFELIPGPRSITISSMSRVGQFKTRND